MTPAEMTRRDRETVSVLVWIVVVILLVSLMYAMTDSRPDDPERLQETHERR